MLLRQKSQGNWALSGVNSKDSCMKQDFLGVPWVAIRLKPGTREAEKKGERETKRWVISRFLHKEICHRLRRNWRRTVNKWLYYPINQEIGRLLVFLWTISASELAQPWCGLKDSYYILHLASCSMPKRHTTYNWQTEMNKNKFLLYCSIW